MKKIKGNFTNALSIDRSLTKNKVLFALWTGMSYATLGLSVYSYLKFNQDLGNIFLEASILFFANGFNYGLNAEKRAEEIKNLKSGANSSQNLGQEI